jgi:hypothetical protein
MKYGHCLLCQYAIRKIYNKGQARLFKSNFLEALTKAHPLVIWGMYLPVIGYMLYHAAADFNFSTKKILVLFLAGMLFWSFLSIWHTFSFFGKPKAKELKKLFILFMAAITTILVILPGFLCRPFPVSSFQVQFSALCFLL